MQLKSCFNEFGSNELVESELLLISIASYSSSKLPTNSCQQCAIRARMFFTYILTYETNPIFPRHFVATGEFGSTELVESELLLISIASYSSCKLPTNSCQQCAIKARMFFTYVLTSILTRHFVATGDNKYYSASFPVRMYYSELSSSYLLSPSLLQQHLKMLWTKYAANASELWRWCL